MLRFPSPSVLVSITALVVALGGAGFAATGGNFILGKINTAENQSGIVSPVNGKMLLLNNTSTDANATALGLTVKPGHPPMVVNTQVKVPNLNVDLLDGFDQTSFAKVLGLKGLQRVTGTLVAGNNFFLAPAFDPAFDGRCEVTVSTQVSSNVGINTRGPFYRGAIKRGVAAPANDGAFGHYFPPIWGAGASLVSPDLTRVSVYDVTAGESLQFGAFLGNPDGNWQGKSVEATVAYYCTTTATFSGSATKVARSGAAAPDMAALQQDRAR